MHKSFCFSVLLVLLAATDLCAQWKNVGPRLFTVYDSSQRINVNQGGRGAMHFADGIIWAGVNGLFSSADSGRSWQRIPFPALNTTLIRDINFFDKWNGLVATSDEGVLMTHDGGNSWHTILSTTGDMWKAMFNGSPQTIHALGVDNGVCYTSRDGGTSWSQSYIGPYVSCLAIAPDRTVYVFAQQLYKWSTAGWISYSTDLGTTWIKNSTMTDGDSYTLSADSCDPNKLYLLNEDWATSLDDNSEVYVTSDRGNSWLPYDKQTVPYFTGPLATTKHVLYAGTDVEDGIVRSTDNGVTWKSIGGPTTEGDSRTVLAVDDNTVFVLDTKGEVWATFNSGGDPLKPIAPNPALQFSSARIINDSINIILHLPIYYRHQITEWDARMVMHYPTASLKFLGTSLYNGKHFDLPSGQWPGRVELDFSSADLNAAPDSLLGYINFLWNPFEYSCNDIIFDSIYTVDPCTDPKAQPFHGIIGSYKTCGQESVSAANATGEEQTFNITPNPAGEYTVLSSQSFSGNILVTLYDLSGRLCTSYRGAIADGVPMKIGLNNFSAGMYTLIVQGEGVRSTLSFIRK